MMRSLISLLEYMPNMNTTARPVQICLPQWQLVSNRCAGVSVVVALGSSQVLRDLTHSDDLDA
jgi:hypothetical protein